LDLKEYCHTVDGIVVSFLLGYPEIFESDTPYRVSDSIINGIMSSCIHNYSQVVKDTKEIRKKLKKSVLSNETAEFPSFLTRRNSWWLPILSFMDSIRGHRSKATIFRLAVLTQSRASGLADKKMASETVDDFIKAVTEYRYFDPTREMIDSIEDYTDEVVAMAGGPSPKFKISMSTSACFESSRKSEGKFGFLKACNEIFFDPPEPLRAGGPGGTIGTPIFEEALARFDKDEIMKVNVAAIRENGKSRVVTSGSFWKDALLQPFSHLTIEMCKSQDELRNSFEFGRLGWHFIQDIVHYDPKRGLPLFADDPVIYSFDWVKSTDYPTHKMGRMLMTSLLSKTGLDPDILEKVVSVWAGEKELYTNVRGKKTYRGLMVNGIPMGDPMTKTCLSSAHPICHKYALKMILKNHPEEWTKGYRDFFVVAAGNGDDGVRISNGKLGRIYFRYFKEGAKMLGYLESPLDSAITSDWGNYCEEWFRIPIDRFHTVYNSNRLKDTRLSPYLDVPKIRLILDTKKQREDFSSDPQGKYTLMGKDQEYVRNDSDQGINTLFEIASVLQDVCLGLKDRKEPVYLPRQIFGTGKPVPNWNVESWKNAIFSQRWWPRTVTINAVKEILANQRYLTAYRGRAVTSEKHFQKEAYLEVLEIPPDDPIRNFRLIRADQWDLFPANVLEKLIGSGKLVLASQVAKYYLYSKRIESMSQDIEQVNLFSILKGMSLELTEYTEEDTKTLLGMFKLQYEKSPWQLKYQFQEDIYPHSVVDIMHQADPLRVDLPGYDYLLRFKKKVKPDTPYQRNVERLYEWFENNFTLVLNGEVYENPPVDIIEDDPIILRQVVLSESDLIVIITNDVKLFRNARNRATGKFLARISIEDWVNYDADESQFLKIVRDIWPHLTHEFIVDQGALETFLLKTDLDPTRYPGFNETAEGVRRTQADIWDVYLPPRILTTTNIFSVLRMDRTTVFAMNNRFRRSWRS